MARTKPTLRKIQKARVRLAKLESDALQPDERPKPGQPTLWNEELEAKLFSRLAKGRTLKRICADDADMPDMMTVMKWGQRDPEFLHRLAEVRRIQSHALVDDVLEIADDARNDWMEKQNRDGSTYEVPNMEVVQRSRLRVAVRQWIAGKYNREDYGERPTQNVQINGPVQINTEERAAILQELRGATIDVPQLEKKP